jgi:hypothetical protein
MSSSQLENVKIGEAAFQRFAAQLKALGFTVSEDHGIDPATGMIAYMSVTIGDAKINWVEAQATFAQINAANIMIGVGTNLRRDLYTGVNNGSIKLHDFGFRGRK